MAKKRVLKIGPEFELPADVLAEINWIAGQRGTGKSSLAKVITEEGLKIGRCPFVVLDLTGVWWGLRLGSDGSSPAFDIPILGGLHGDISLDPKSGKMIGQLVAEHQQSFALTW